MDKQFEIEEQVIQRAMATYPDLDEIVKFSGESTHPLKTRTKLD